MKTLSVITHGTCATCKTEKTVFIYRVDGKLIPPICGQCELDSEKGIVR